MSEQIQACNYRTFRKQFYRRREKRLRDVKNVIVIIADYLTTQLCILGDVNSCRNIHVYPFMQKRKPLIPDMLKWKLLFDIKAQKVSVSPKYCRDSKSLLLGETFEWSFLVQFEKIASMSVSIKFQSVLSNFYNSKDKILSMHKTDSIQFKTVPISDWIDGRKSSWTSDDYGIFICRFIYLVSWRIHEREMRWLGCGFGWIRRAVECETLAFGKDMRRLSKLE